MADRNLLLTRPASSGDRMPQGRRILDLAQGVLIALRRYRPEAAFAELIAVAHENDVSVSALAAALVMLATGTDHESSARPEALVVAHRVWADALDA